jgi:S-DNA-T family DNA segregation ATPase FtsK/SpoIIIE
MPEERKRNLDLLALVLLAGTVFLAAALLSHDPADPPARLVHPPRPFVANVCGRAGAAVSHLLFNAIGLGAYYLLASLVVLDAALLARRAIDQPYLRAFGWVLSLVGVSTLSAMAIPGLSPGTVIGSGGYLGAAFRGWLELHFANVGAYILVLSVVVGGLLLCTDYLLPRLLAWLVGRPAHELSRGVLCVGTAYAKRLGQRRTDLNGDETDSSAEVTVRITGRQEGPNASARPAGDAEPQSADNDKLPEIATRRGGSGEILGLGRRGRGADESDLGQLPREGSSAAADYELPGLDLLLPGEPFSFEEQEREVRRKAKLLEKTFADFGYNVRVMEIQTGPVVAQFEVELEAGLRLSKITTLADDLAIALRVPSVRIVAPIPGKNTVGVEVPNNERQIVRLREVMEEAGPRAAKMRIPLFLGKDVAGNPMVIDLATLPHLLIAGRTGTGKSVCLNSIIASLLMTRRPDEVRLLLIDPKMVELSPYKDLPHLMHPVITDMRKAEAVLAWAVEKMEERYHLLARAGVRHIGVYNQLGEEELMERIRPENDEQRQQIPTHLPYVVIVADELADLMMTAAKEVEGHIIRLAQKSRAVGIHLVLATQKPTVDVITGLIKSNLPARICFQVASRTDSRVVLDEMGAERLLGNGDMLFLWPGTSTLIRGQGTFLSDDEINRIIAAVATSEPQYVKELVQLKVSDPAGGERLLSSRDELYETAVDLVIREGRGSVSLLQRVLGIGYGRAARLIDYMAEDGIVGPYNGSQARDVLISLEEWEQRCGQSATARNAAIGNTATPPRHSHRILLGSADGAGSAPVSPLAIPRALASPTAMLATSAKSATKLAAAQAIAEEDAAEHEEEEEATESEEGKDVLAAATAGVPPETDEGPWEEGHPACAEQDELDELDALDRHDDQDPRHEQRPLNRQDLQEGRDLHDDELRDEIDNPPFDAQSRRQAESA